MGAGKLRKGYEGRGSASDQVGSDEEVGLITH